MSKFMPFETWSDVLESAHNGRSLYYHAPLDHLPAFVFVVRVFKNGKLRLRAGGVTFTADAGHLSRFRYFAFRKESAHV